MEHFFVTLFHNNADVLGQWGVLILFVVAFVESLPILGTFLPGQATIIFGGFLVKLGFFGFWPALLAAACGAVLGDLAGFALGKKYGPKILKREKMIIDKKHFESTVKLIEDNGIKSIFIGRMHSFTRTLVPFAAGMSKINFKKFFAVDIITAIIWALACLSIGYIFGKSFDLAAAFIGKFFLMATLITIILVAAVSHMRQRGGRIAHIDAVLFGISVSFLYLFTITATNFASGRFYRILDLKMAHFAQIFNTEWLNTVMIFFTQIGNPTSITLLGILLVLALLHKSRFFDAGFVLFTLGAGALLVDSLKAVFLRARPIGGIITETGSSFPSGHATLATILAILLYYMILRKIKDDKQRGISIFFASLVAFAIGLSRVYLNVHWASDVLAGFALGIFLSTFLIVIFRLLDSVIKKTKRSHTIPDIP